MGEGLGYAVLPDLYGVEASRFATQAVGAGFSLILLAVFWLLRRRWPFPGAAFLMLLLLYFTGGLFPRVHARRRGDLCRRLAAGADRGPGTGGAGRRGPAGAVVAGAKWRGGCGRGRETGRPENLRRLVTPPAVDHAGIRKDAKDRAVLRVLSQFQWLTRPIKAMPHRRQIAGSPDRHGTRAPGRRGRLPAPTLARRRARAGRRTRMLWPASGTIGRAGERLLDVVSRDLRRQETHRPEPPIDARRAQEVDLGAGVPGRAGSGRSSSPSRRSGCRSGGMG